MNRSAGDKHFYDEESVLSEYNPCILCGACCAYYRAGFYRGETTEIDPCGVPVEMTQVIAPFIRAMNGTLSKPPRCVALVGEIGKAVYCSIHSVRSSSCRDFMPSFAEGTRNERCDKARLAHGIRPLTPEDWPNRPKPRKPPTRKRRARRRRKRA